MSDIQQPQPTLVPDTLPIARIPRSTVGVAPVKPECVSLPPPLLSTK